MNMIVNASDLVGYEAEFKKENKAAQKDAVKKIVVCVGIKTSKKTPRNWVDLVY